MGGLGGTCPPGSWYLKKQKRSTQKQKNKKEKEKLEVSHSISVGGNFALTFIHRNVQVDVDAVVKEFARKQPRRIILPDILFEEA